VSEEKGHEIVIVRRSRGGDHGHHGGAWKIAFADFMTAMMALFLVLWLLSATNEKTKASLARYFNPVKLVDMTVQKRGLHDPIERSTEDSDNEAPPPSRPSPQDKNDSKNPAGLKGQKIQKGAASAGEFEPTHTEGALFRDPYAVLAEIAAAGPGNKSPDKSENQNVGAAASFQDPFQAGAPEVPQAQPPQGPPLATVDPTGADETAPLIPPTPAAAPTVSGYAAVPPPKPTTTVATPAKQGVTAAQTPADQANEAALSAPQKEGVTPPVKSQAAQQTQGQQIQDKQAKLDKQNGKDQPKTPSQEEVIAARLQSELGGLFGKSAAAPQIKVKPAPGGVLISLTDDFDYAMFAIGSAEPQKRTVLVMEKIAHILKTQPGKIVISGHTDGRQYKTRNYDNWRLSQARAEMALYMLVRGGLEESRVEKIEGDADHDLKVPSDPYAAENRRIEILLRTKKS
jgi:chemotaxis protein MotB